MVSVRLGVAKSPPSPLYERGGHRVGFSERSYLFQREGWGDFASPRLPEHASIDADTQGGKP